MITEANRVTQELRGQWHGYFGIARCPAHADKRPSLSIADGSGGRLLLRCHAGCEFAAIASALRDRRVLAEWREDGAVTEAELAQQRLREDAHRTKQSTRAKAVWNDPATVPISGSLAETYLRSRGITCDLPYTLRFNPSAWHPSAVRLPMMLGAVEASRLFGVHRTYLSCDGNNKADVLPAKAMLGPVTGGTVRLTSEEGPLVICEGIETGLSLASGLVRRPATIWAALSTAGMRAMNLPSLPGRLLIASDGDEPGRAAAHALGTRASSLGWRVSLLPAPEGQDWNDVLIMKGAN